MNKSEAIKLLTSEKWTKADVQRALVEVDFSTNPDELTIRRAISSFAGSELINRQRLQSAQKTLVTKKNKEIQEIRKYLKQLEEGKKKLDSSSDQNGLKDQIKTLIDKNKKLFQANQALIKDNKDLKNIVDRIKLQLAIDTNKLLKYEDSELRQGLIKLFKWTLG